MQTKRFQILINLLKTDYSVKITEIESKIPSTSGLATNSALTAVENKIPDISNLVKKKQQIMVQKLVKLKKKLQIIIMVTTSEFNNLTAKTFSRKISTSKFSNKDRF